MLEIIDSGGNTGEVKAALRFFDFLLDSFLDFTLLLETVCDVAPLDFALETELRTGELRILTAGGFAEESSGFLAGDGPSLFKPKKKSSEGISNETSASATE
jgi:hypothetical protein